MNIKNSIRYSVLDFLTMFKRCVLLSFRSPDMLLTGILNPVLLMILFVYVLGGAMDVGDYNYINYIVPGVIIQCIGQCASITSVSVNSDMTRGIIDRFRSMPIARSSLLTGHALAAAVRNIVTTAAVIGVALLMGFRPEAGAVQWLIVMGILILFILAITWISVIFGLISGSAESATSLSIITIVLPYLSSGFVPTESMPSGLRAFAENQPMTPIIEAVRSLMMNTSTDGKLLSAVLWCAGMLAASYITAVNIYKKRLAK